MTNLIDNATIHPFLILFTTPHTACWRTNIWNCFSTQCANIHRRTCILKPSPYTFLDGGFHCVANKGRQVSPGASQALREQQWPRGTPAGQSGRDKATLFWSQWQQRVNNTGLQFYQQEQGHMFTHSPVLSTGAALHHPAWGTCLWSGWGCSGRVWSL